MLPPGYPRIPSKNVSPFGPAIWPAIGNIYTNVLFYFIDNVYFAWVSVCLFVRLNPINVKTAEPIGPKSVIEVHMTSEKVYER